jgi:hypothetical protein
MLQHVFRTVRYLTRQSVGKRAPAALEVMALEERATPDATPVWTMPMGPQIVVTAPAIAGSTIVTPGSLAIPMAGQSMVRLDLIAPGEGAEEQHADDGSEPEVPDSVIAKVQPEAAVAQPSNTISDEELAEYLALQEAA